MIYLTRRVLSLALLILVAQPVQAALFLVTDPYDSVDASPGDSICADADGHCTLRAAVQESNALNGEDIIILPAGRFTLSLPGNAEHAAAAGDLDLLQSVTVRGQGPDRTIIDAGGIDRAFEAINAGTVLIENLTIENGVAGVNTPGYFSVNSGGAIATAGNSSTLTLKAVVLRNNQAQSGGGLYNVYSTVVINNSTLQDNIATTGSGGGIAEGLASYTRLYNVTLSGNRAAQSGGGMITTNNTALMFNVTINGNIADSDANGSGDGGGIAQGFTAPTLSNSIVAGNIDRGGEAPDCSGSITSDGYNLMGNNLGCSIAPAPGDRIGTAIVPIDAGLKALTVAENGVPMYALAVNSLAIDAANPAVPGSGGNACVATDARGADRTLNTPCDIGAYEVATFGRTFIVNSMLDRVDANPGDGVCETSAGNQECTLRAAIQEANGLDGADRIEVPAGTIVLTRAGADEDLSATGDLDVTQATRIVGAGRSQTIIDANGLDRAFHLSTTGRIEIEGLTIRNGVVTNDNGGGILLTNTGALELTDVQISGNRAQSGGGIYAVLWSWMNDGMLNMARCVIEGNTATSHGGGFANFTFRISKIDASTFSNNVAQIGGGIFNSFMSTALIQGSTISANRAQSGGGIGMLWGRGVMTLVNTTLSGNTATLAGGGISGTSSDLVNLFSSTVTLNRAAGSADGGGINSPGPVRLGNSVLAGNLDDDRVAPDCAATLSSFGYNLIGTNAGCTIAALGTDRIGTSIAPLDPRLESLATYGDAVAYHRPFDDSPLLNAGNPNLPGNAGGGCPVTDQRNVNRILNAPCDIGAVERRNADIALTASARPFNVVRAAQMDYLMQVTNAGPDTATGISLALTPAVGSHYVAVDGTGWTCSTLGASVICQGMDLPSGGVSDLRLTLTVPDSSGAMSSVAGVATASWDANTSNNAALVNFSSNAPPVITGLSDLSFTGDADNLPIAAALTLMDIDTATIDYATVQFVSGYVGGEDLLFLSVYAGLTASWDAVNGILSISGRASLSTYQTVLRNIRYSNLAALATAGDRQIRISVSDGIFENALANVQLSLPVAARLALTAAGGLGNTAAIQSSPAETASAEVSEQVSVNETSTSEVVEMPSEQDTQPAQDQTDDTQATALATSASSGRVRATRATKQSAVLPQQSSNMTESVEVASIASAEFWNEISSMREQMATFETTEKDAPQQLMIDTAKTVTVFLFAGATNWYLKGTSLLASLFSSLPLWTPFDPLPILALNKRMRRRRERTQAAAAALERRYSVSMARLLDMRHSD